MPRSRPRGFTLIELMIVVAIVSILAMIAYPIYSGQARKGRRAEAKEALAKAAFGEEKWRMNHANYSIVNSEVGVTSPTVSNYYTIAITTSATGSCPNGGAARSAANNYTVTATKAGDQTSDTNCATMTLTNDCGAVTKASSPSAECW